MASIQFDKIEKNFGKTKVIHSLGFDIADGEFVVLEPTGAETEVVLDTGGQSLVAVHPGRIGVTPNALVGVGAKAAGGHVFDKRSGKRLN